MHLDPDDLTPAATEVWPRVRVDRPAPNADRTRLALEGLGDVAEPTANIPAQAVPAAPDTRTRPAPDVRPIPAAARSRAAHPSRPRMDPSGAALINHVLDEQARLNAAHAGRMATVTDAFAARIRRTGPGGWFGWKPASGPSVAEVAAARVKIAEQEERRRYRHARHMDRLEAVRAYLGVFALVLLMLLIGCMAALAFGIMAGWWNWGPTH